MRNLPQLTADDAISQRLAEYVTRAKGALADNTERALRSDTKVFTEWCAKVGLRALPAAPDTLVSFIDAQSQSKSAATIARYVSSISRLHRAAGLDNPSKNEAVRLAVRRMRRSQGVRPKQVQALNRHHVDRMLAAAGDERIHLRNKALLSVAYDTLMRRSELAALEVDDVTLAEDGSGSVLIRRSKGDQTGEGAVVYIAPDTATHVKNWLSASGITNGALFRGFRRGGQINGTMSDKAVSLVFKRMSQAASLELVPSGHSTRIGAAQDMTAAGLGTAEILQAGRWKSPAMIARYTEHQQARRGASARLAAIQGRV